MRKILAWKGFQSAKSLPEAAKEIMATRATRGRRTAFSASSGKVLSSATSSEDAGPTALSRHAMLVKAAVPAAGKVGDRMTSAVAVDDLGAVVPLPAEVARVVSIVPSLTEAIAATHRELLIGATDWCTHPADLDVARVRGTKNPEVDTIRALAPDVVIANAEENRAADLDALRAAGLAVWVTAPTTVPEALDSLDRMLLAVIGETPDWLKQARAVWAAPYEGSRRRAVVPIWRRPWMALGRDTFAGDLLSRLGLDNVLADSPDRYPRIDLHTLPAYDVVVLPDEPYAFSPADGPEAFEGPSVCVSGRYLTWYGPSLVSARDLLTGQLGTG
jgi:ABC-type Fe3+-hydroxamate transport system substrate-binding protein